MKKIKVLCQGILLMLICVICFSNTIPVKGVTQRKFTKISLGGAHSSALEADGSLWTWGRNWDGELGDGTVVSKTKPVKVLSNVADVKLGFSHSAAIKKDGSLWLWGNNLYGELGNGTTNNTSTPIKVMDGVKAVDLGVAFTLALKNDGSLWAWGNNESGQLGDGTDTDRKKPVKIMTNVATFSAGTFACGAVKNDGSLWTWGSNECAQVGNGTMTESQKKPVKIMSEVKAVSIGGWHGGAIKNDGSLWMWGDNSIGQLGNNVVIGDAEPETKPIKIMDGIKLLDLGPEHTTIIKNDDSLWVFGDNYSGQLGDGTYKDKSRPTEISKKILAVSATFCNTAMIKQDGTVWVWGENDSGQLGNGTTKESVNPIQVKFPAETVSNKMTGISATQSTNAVTLQWAKVTGATGYEIYQYASSTRTFTKLGSTTGLKYTRSKLAAGTNYSYAIKPIKKINNVNYIGWVYSGVFNTATKPSTPAISLAKSRGKALLRWKQIKGANGYEVFMRTNTGAFVKIKTITNVKTLSFIKTGLSSKRTYMFRIRAYKTVGSKKIYSAYSAAKK